MVLYKSKSWRGQNSFSEKGDNVFNKISGWKLQALVKFVHQRGVRVSHRNSVMRFDEKEATLLLSTSCEPISGLSIGDDVAVDGLRLSPWLYANGAIDGIVRNVEAASDCMKFGNRMFQVIAFYRVTGSLGGARFEGIFCALLDDQNLICTGQELGAGYGQDEKVRLYWTGCLTRAEDIGKE